MNTYAYRIYDNGQILYRDMTPNKAAWYAARYDVRVEPVEPGTPIAPDGIVEKWNSLTDERPRR